jgi:hypothetical protein
MTEKVGMRHLCRKAIVYVRQSSAHQAQHRRVRPRRRRGTLDPNQATGIASRHSATPFNSGMGRTQNVPAEETGAVSTHGP